MSRGLSPSHVCSAHVRGTVPETCLFGTRPGDCPRDMSVSPPAMRLVHPRFGGGFSSHVLGTVPRTCAFRARLNVRIAEWQRRRYVRPMARQPRYVLPEIGVFHVTARGVAGMDIFRDDADRTRFAFLQR